MVLTDVVMPLIVGRNLKRLQGNMLLFSIFANPVSDIA